MKASEAIQRLRAELIRIRNALTAVRSQGVSLTFDEGDAVDLINNVLLDVQGWDEPKPAKCNAGPIPPGSACVFDMQTGERRAVPFSEAFPESDLPKLQLREGAWYRRRNGQEVEVSKSPFLLNGFVAGNLAYNQDGTLVGGQGIDAFDLIAEVPPPTQAGTQPEPAATSPTNCQAESTSESGEKFTNNGVNSLRPLKARDWVVVVDPDESGLLSRDEVLEVQSVSVSGDLVYVGNRGQYLSDGWDYRRFRHATPEEVAKATESKPTDLSKPTDYTHWTIIDGVEVAQ